MSTFHVQPHESGAGNWLFFVAGDEFKLTRLIDLESGEQTVLEGVFASDSIYMDWGITPRDPTIYRYYVLKDGEYALESEWELRGDPAYIYDPFGDTSLTAAADPRDALIVFFSTRLAQMVRSGEVRVSNENHASFFPVRRAWGFDAAELPAVSATYTEGAGRGADLGGGLMEEVLQVQLEITSSNPSELDAVSSAIRKITLDLEQFLYSLDCVGLSYGGFNEFLYGEERGAGVEPQFYGARLSFGTTMYSRRELRQQAGGWQLVPSWTPRAGYGRAVITSAEAGQADLERLERQSRAKAGLAD